MEADQKLLLPDVQSSKDARNIAINRVGVRGLSMPIVIAGKAGPQHTIAELTMTVSLPASQKGTHMSRFVALMELHRQPYDVDVMKALMHEMLESLHAEEGTIEIRFPFLSAKQRPSAV